MSFEPRGITNEKEILVSGAKGMSQRQDQMRKDKK